MNELPSGSRSPQPMKRERDEDNNLETPLYIEKSRDLDSFPEEPLTNQSISRLALTPLRVHSSNRDTSPARSSTGPLSDAGTRTPSPFPSSSVTAFTALNGIIEPPKKRVKMTFQEKEEKRMMKAVRDQEKAEERAQREAERRMKEQDKARRDLEKEAERKRKDAEKEEKRLAKDAEKAEKERERKAREDDKRRKEEEKQRLEIEKKRKERTQPKLNLFFKTSGTETKDDTPRRLSIPESDVTIQLPAISGTKSPGNYDSKSYYEKKFPPFFVQSNVKVAPITRFIRDAKASKILHEAIDTYIDGGESSDAMQAFTAARLFNLPDTEFKVRGRKPIPVREIMSHIHGDAKRPIDLTTDSQNIQIKNTRKLLKTIPYKILSFAEDIRPPYKGTYTSQPVSGMHKLARNPTRRDLPLVNYDYDSEAEWEAEEGEDIESDGEDEEDIADGEEDIEEFLDDAEAETVNARKLVMQGDLEPKCSGLCWEDERKRGPDLKMYHYVLEVITESSQIQTPIDPFSTRYWETPALAGLMEPPRVPLNTVKATSASMNGPSTNPPKMFGTPNMKKAASQSHKTAPPSKKLVCAEDMPAFRQAVDGSELSKLGLIEVLNKQFSKIPKATIKCTLENIAKRVGSKEAEKRWVLMDYAEI